MLFLITLLIFISQIFVYLIFGIMKKRVNRWVTLGYTILDVLLAVPFGFIVLFLGVMGTDSGTDESVRAAYIFMGVSAVIYLGIFILSLVNTIKSFKEYNPQTEKKEKGNDQ